MANRAEVNGGRNLHHPGKGPRHYNLKGPVVWWFDVMDWQGLRLVKKVKERFGYVRGISVGTKRWVCDPLDRSSGVKPENCDKKTVGVRLVRRDRL